MGRSDSFPSVPALRDWLDKAPAGTLLSADAVRAALDGAGTDEAATVTSPSDNAAATSWREKLWVVPGDTRIGAVEVAEAIGRSRDWVYRAVNPDLSEKKGRDPLPCRRLDGELVFVVTEIRDWLNASEEVLQKATRRPLRIAGS